MGLNDRLRRLVARAGMSPTGDERVVASRKVLARMSTPELRSYVNALRRMKAGGSPGEEDGPILRRVKKRYEEVRHVPRVSRIPSVNAGREISGEVSVTAR